MKAETITTTANEYVALDNEIKALSKRKAELKAIIEAYDATHIETDTHTITVKPVSTARLDMTAVRKKLSAQFISRHTTKSESTRITIKSK